VSLLQTSENINLKEVTDHALAFTDDWMLNEYNRFLKDDWSPNINQNYDLMKEEDCQFETKSDYNLDNALRHWDEATERLGIVTYKTKKVRKLQLWRAMTEVGGYIACTPSKRRVLKKLVKYGRQFSAERTRHIAFLLIDSPGTGKSYLVECLARHLRMRFISFNITQMLTREDLLRSFDKIVTSQAQNPEESLLVFVDEINAKLDGQEVYDSFLAPLEQGIYVRGGNTFHIAPCVWIFAGTRRPNPESENILVDLSNKGSDFETRLTLPPMDLGVDNDNHMDTLAARYEKIYIGAAAIQRYFPDVRFVSDIVLDALNVLPPDTPPRMIAQFVKQFRNVQYGMVTSANLPTEWNVSFKVHDGQYHNWKIQDFDNEEKRMVQLESDPHDDPARSTI